MRIPRNVLRLAIKPECLQTAGRLNEALVEQSVVVTPGETSDSKLRGIYQCSLERTLNSQRPLCGPSSIQISSIMPSV
jgi:hypothetical protein